jgi:MprA protease rhombosortase-interaction domain-containing protein
MIELALAVLLLAAGIVFYRRKPAPEDSGASSYGNQDAVLMLVIGVIVGIHALGGLDYHPTQTETDMMKARHP